MMQKVLPGKIRRSAETNEFESELKSFLRKTTAVRDLDTLAVTLEGVRSLLPTNTLEYLRNERSDAAAAAAEAMRGITQALSDHPEIPSLGNAKLSRRLRMRINQKSNAVQSLLRRVKANESDFKRLHSLRKETRRLRYLTELARKSGPFLVVLEDWQGLLGKIHDKDVAIGYLRAHSSGTSVEDAIRKLQEERHSDYLSFINAAGVAATSSAIPETLEKASTPKSA